MKRLFAMSCMYYLLIGVTSVLLGSMLPVLLPYYGRAYSDGGMLLFLQFVGFLLGVTLSPWYTLRYGRRPLLILSLLSIVLPYAVMGFLPGWSWMVALTMLIGFGSGIIESTIGAFTIEFAEAKKAVAMTQLDVYFGVGALAMPALISLFMYMGMWQLAFFTASGAALILLLLWMTLPAPSRKLLERTSEMSQEENTAAGTTGKRRRYTAPQLRILSLFVIFFFVYMGLELSMMNFLPSIVLETISIDPSAASLSVTVFWVAMVVGRLFVGHLAERMKYVPFLIWSCVGSLLLVSGLALSGGSVSTFLLISGAGLCLSGLFSIALVFANQLIPGMTERTTSILVAAGGIGGSILQLAVGWSMEEWSAGVTLWILSGFVLILFAVILISQISMNRHNRSASGDTLLTIDK